MSRAAWEKTLTDLRARRDALAAELDETIGAIKALGRLIGAEPEPPAAEQAPEKTPGKSRPRPAAVAGGYESIPLRAARLVAVRGGR